MIQQTFKILVASMLVITLANATSALVLKNSNVREEPSLTSSKVAYVKQGDKVEILQHVTDADKRVWYKTDKGYILGRLLSVEKHSAATNKKVVFLNAAQVKELLVDKTRIGVTRNSKNGIFYRSIFKKDGRVIASLHQKNGLKIKDVPVGKWIINNDGTFCILRGNKKTNTSCRRVLNKGNYYASVLTSDNKVWEKFVIADK
ncbi:MAG: SH3 domain-containing protein [Sulfurimonas sp.]|nr:SH3 domain-containing protein [Sulfurimonas sp.]MBU3938779.1 SH3 domain-containing protein [bacterium]MBU4024265.1 SH3 domain-containing protein [bacterium]MBU4058800.1 SH3 domain-containing protein [bacterium]MBU4109786.1 SH3 domain-containing protein [bacterium]